MKIALERVAGSKHIHLFYTQAVHVNYEIYLMQVEGKVLFEK
jgi:hypothetical protein